MKNVEYLIKYATAQIGRPYWYGTFGQIASEWLYHYNKSRLPEFYKANDFVRQFGQKVHDCNGLIKGAMWCDTPDAVPTHYTPNEDFTIRGIYDAAIHKGLVSESKSIPEGALVIASTFGHIGIYTNGWVIHAKGHAFGVVREVFTKSNWCYWCECIYFDYKAEPKPDSKTELKRGDMCKLLPEATIYGTNKKFADFVYTMPVYVLEQNKNRVVFSIYKDGAVTGATLRRYLVKMR